MKKRSRTVAKRTVNEGEDGDLLKSFRFLPGEVEAIEQVLDAGRLYGYGNMISYLQEAWSELLQKDSELSKKEADLGAGNLMAWHEHYEKKLQDAESRRGKA